jgi:hypothetical protein
MSKEKSGSCTGRSRVLLLLLVFLCIYSLLQQNKILHTVQTSLELHIQDTVATGTPGCVGRGGCGAEEPEKKASAEENAGQVETEIATSQVELERQDVSAEEDAEQKNQKKKGKELEDLGQAETEIATSRMEQERKDASAKEEKAAVRELGAHTTRPFTFEGKRFLDAFVAPTPFSTSSTSAALVMPSFNLRAQEGEKGRRCRFANNQTTDLVLFRGAEVYVCLVPEQALLLSSDEAHTIRVSLESGRDETTIDAALWPWHSRGNHYTVANTCMAKNIECGRDLLRNPNHCFHEWIMWNRMQGITHFLSTTTTRSRAIRG